MQPAGERKLILGPQMPFHYQSEPRSREQYPVYPIDDIIGCIPRECCLLIDLLVPATMRINDLFNVKDKVDGTLTARNSS